MTAESPPDPDEQDLSRAELAYKRLREGIRAGEFRPGQRLRETELASRLTMSRTPVREAIRRLASDGLIEVAPSRGVMIIDLNKQQVRELYALRETLEGAAARLAAQHASPAEIEAMGDLRAHLELGCHGANWVAMLMWKSYLASLELGRCVYTPDRPS